MFSFLMIQVPFSVVYNIFRELQYCNFKMSLTIEKEKGKAQDVWYIESVTNSFSYG